MDVVILVSSIFQSIYSGKFLQRRLDNKIRGPPANVKLKYPAFFLCIEPGLEPSSHRPAQQQERGWPPAGTDVHPAGCLHCTWIPGMQDITISIYFDLIIAFDCIQYVLLISPPNFLLKLTQKTLT